MHAQIRRTRRQRGFSLLETMVALVLLAMAMTSLVVAFVGSGKLGILARRQANAVAVARSLAGQLSHVAWTDARIANSNANNDATFADPNGLFALPTLPAGNDAPDTTLPNQTVGNENYEVYVNVSSDPNPASEQGRFIAVIVRYHVANQYMRAVALGYHYNPNVVGTGAVPLPL